MKTRFIYLTKIATMLAVVLFSGSVSAQYSLDWVHEYTNEYNAIPIKGIKHDASNNIYVLGNNYADTLDVDFSGNVVNVNPTPYDYALFLAKYSSNGSFLWVKSITSPEENTAIYSTTLQLDGAGNIYISGYFYAPEGVSIDFDPGVGVVNLTQAAEERVGFLLKLNSNGDFQWVKTITGTGVNLSIGPNISAIEIDGANNVYIAGEFDGTYNFGAPSNFSLTSPNVFNKSGFLAKYDSSGDFQWAKGFIQDASIGNSFINCSIEGLQVTSSDIYLEGWYSGNPDFNPGASVDTLGYIFSMNEVNSFIVKLNLSGEFVYAKRITGGQNFIASAKMDASGDLYVVGNFSGTVDFDMSASTNNLVSNGFSDGFVAKYNSVGDLSWVQSLGGQGYEYIIDLQIINSSVAMVGYYEGTVDFDSGSGESESTSALSDCFILLLNSEGAYLTNYVWGGNGNDYSSILSKDNNDNLVISGVNGSTDMSYDGFDRGGSSGPSFLMRLELNTTSSIAFNENEQFVVYPNPASNQININELAYGSTITITDISGRVVFTSTASNELMSISTENWSSGLYLIQTELNGAVQQEKVVVQK